MNKYTKQSNSYTTPANGYIRIYLPVASSTAEIYGYDKVAKKDFMIYHVYGNANSAFYSFYIKKGISLYVNLSANTNVNFLNIQ